MPPVHPEHQKDAEEIVSISGDKITVNNNLHSQDEIIPGLPNDIKLTRDPYFQSAFNNGFVGMLIADLQGQIVQVNHAFGEILSYDGYELFSNKIFSIVCPEDVTDYQNTWNQLLLMESDKATTLESRYQNKLQQSVWCRNSFSLIKDSTYRPINIMITCVNIQEEKRALQKSEEVAKRFRFLADSMPQQIWTADANGKLNYFSQAFYEYTGMTKEDIDKRNWSSIVFEDDKEITNDAWKRSLGTGEEFVVEHRLRSRDGNYKWQLSRAMAQRDNHGNIIMWVGATTNIHKQKKIEEQLEKQVLERTHDLQEANFNLKHSNHDLEQFAYIATHDLQEPLRKIRTYSSWINKRFREGLPEEAQDYMIKIENASERMSKLIDDLLNYSILLRPLEPFEILDLNTILGDVLSDFDLLIKEKHAVIQKATLPHLKAIPIQMHQLFSNLLSNSLKFTADDREPLIRITSRELPIDEVIALHLDMDLPYTEIVFIDNGIGFNEEYAEKIFVIFQRLNNRKKYSGTGIGLALCQKIVIYHHGLIYAKSTQDKGASFYIVLPL